MGRRHHSRVSRRPLARSVELPEAYSDLAYWLDAAHGVEYGTSPDVLSWTPRAGSDPTPFGGPITAADRPHFTALDTDFSGRPSVDFDGTSQYLSRTTALGADGDYTLVVCALSDDITAAQTLHGLGYGATDLDHVALTYAGAPFSAADGSPLAFVEGVAGFVSDASLRIANDTAFVQSIRVEDTGGGAGAITWRSGGTEETETITASAYDTGMTQEVLGARVRFDVKSLFWNGRITEVVRYDRLLSDAEVDEVEAWMAARSGV